MLIIKILKKTILLCFLFPYILLASEKNILEQKSLSKKLNSFIQEKKIELNEILLLDNLDDFEKKIHLLYKEYKFSASEFFNKIPPRSFKNIFEIIWIQLFIPHGLGQLLDDSSFDPTVQSKHLFFEVLESNIPLKLEKIGILISYGMLSFDPNRSLREKFLIEELIDEFYFFAKKTLLLKDPEDLNLFLSVFSKIEFKTLYKKYDDKRTSQFFKKFLEKHLNELVIGFLDQGLVESTRKLLQGAARSNVGFLSPKKDKSSCYEIENFSYLLDSVLEKMFEFRANFSQWSQNKETNYLDLFIKDSLNNKPFNIDALEYVKKGDFISKYRFLRKDRVVILKYICFGMLRNMLLPYLGKILVPKWCASKLGLKDFTSFFMLFNLGKKHFSQLKIYQGFDNLFGSRSKDPIKNKLSQLIKLGIEAPLTLTSSVISGFGLLRSEDSGTCFHILLKQNFSELRTLMLLRILLFGTKDPQESNLENLKALDKDQKSPLDLAKERGFKRVENLLERYLEFGAAAM